MFTCGIGLKTGWKKQAMHEERRRNAPLVECKPPGPVARTTNHHITNWFMGLPAPKSLGSSSLGLTPHKKCILKSVFKILKFMFFLHHFYSRFCVIHLLCYSPFTIPEIFLVQTRYKNSLAAQSGYRRTKLWMIWGGPFSNKSFSKSPE